MGAFFSYALLVAKLTTPEGPLNFDCLTAKTRNCLNVK